VRAVAGRKPFFSPEVVELLLEDHVQRMWREGVSDSYELLTEREREVLQLLAEGKTNKEAAAVLGLGTGTVETHRYNLMQKLNLHNTAELVVYAVKKKILRVWTGLSEWHKIRASETSDDRETERKSNRQLRRPVQRVTSFQPPDYGNVAYRRSDVDKDSE
jgi:DNA-binding CsgD family transcriptional regulator